MTINNDEIKKLFLDPKFGLISINKFVQKLKLNYPNQTFKQNDIKALVENLDAFQQFRKPKREIPLQVYANKNDSYMADLIFYPKYKNQNKGYSREIYRIVENTGFSYAIEDISTNKKQRRTYKAYELLKLKSLPEKITIPEKDKEKIKKNKEELTEEAKQRKINKFLRREGLI